jgi:hypothetical protein
MRSGLLSFILGALTLSLALACSGPTVDVYERPDGTIIVESQKTKATVTAIDARAGTITLKRSWLDEPKTFKVDSDVVNLSRIRVGDVVHAEVIEEVAVTLVPGGAPPEIDAAAVVALSAPGDKPAIVAAESVQVTAEVIAIDGHSHLELPDGSQQTVKAAKHIDLTEVALGDSVLIRITEAVAINVTKPS